MTKPTTIAPKVGGFVEPYFFFSNDFESRITYLSPSVKSILGFEPTDLLGRKYTDLLDPISPLNEGIDECRARRFSGDDAHRQIRVIRDANQRIRVLNVQTYGEEDGNGIVIANHGLAQDITNMFRMEQTIRHRLDSIEDGLKPLSEREQQVLDRVLNGRLNKSTAKDLEISERAVERIRSRVMKKYAAQTTAQLVSKATELKLLKSILETAEQTVSELETPISKDKSRMSRTRQP